MSILAIFLCLYLCLGFVYGMFAIFWGNKKWYLFPINVLGGPLVAMVIICKTLARKDFHI